MPRVEFNQLPPNARVWVFASDRPLTGNDKTTLLDQVDAFLEQWKAHGAPLRSAREWRDDRFLVIGVDPTAEQASGCSIDGLFRGLRALEQTLSTALVAGGRIFYRDTSGIHVAKRNDVRTLAERGTLSPDSTVYDTSLTDAASYRERFQRPARDSWIAPLIAVQDSQSSSRSATNSSSVRNG
jgi:hypothetical protein